MSAICNGTPSRWARQVSYCHVCKCRRRFLVRSIFGGHGFDVVCGGCGSWWGAGQRSHGGKMAARLHRQLVRREWPRAATPSEFHAVLMEELRDLDPPTHPGFGAVLAK